jgi:threonylcarbamoyladenosine tRNA methylthiotransferase MtaB
MPSFAVRNFGCRVNQAEAFAWADAFQKYGLKLDGAWDRSDVVLVNSCTLTGRADRDVRKFIRAAARVNPAVRIIVTGCLAERAPAEIAAMPNVVAVLPQSAKEGIAARLIEMAGGESAPGASAGTDVSAGPGTDAAFRRRAFLKVQDGCDERCAFCVIPSVRGKSRSVAPDRVVAEARDLSGRGFREIVLAGIHLSSYGEDLEPRTTLLDLLRELATAAPGARFRLSSLDPRKTGAELVAHIAASPTVCPHFHLSLQHASARILRLMGRTVGAGESTGVLAELRRLAPDAAIGADVIVGFPGETDADFAELRDLLDASPLSYFHVFPYSPRRGTPAALRPALPAGVVTERAKALRRLSAGKDLRFRRRFTGRTLDGVVIARPEQGEAGIMTGNAVRVTVPACPAGEGQRVRVAIRRVLPHRTEGEVVA